MKITDEFGVEGQPGYVTVRRIFTRRIEPPPRVELVKKTKDGIDVLRVCSRVTTPTTTSQARNFHERHKSDDWAVGYD